MKAPTDHTRTSLVISLVWLRFGVVVLGALCLSHCAGRKGARPAVATQVVVSVKQQKLALYTAKGTIGRTYPVSTSKFGLSDKPGQYGTPLGLHSVVAKIGHGARPGTVFKSRRPTGEVIKPNAPGRDPIVSRIMWLRGMESQNKNAYGRCIYIHGTAAENEIGKPVSYGCIRMKSKDVIDLFKDMGIGSRVLIVEGGLPSKVPVGAPVPVDPVPSDAPPIFLNPQQQPMPAPSPQQQQTPRRFIQPVNLAFNRNQPAQGASQPSEDGMPAYRSNQRENGSTVIYSAPGQPASAPIVLRSRRAPSERNPR